MSATPTQPPAQPPIDVRGLGRPIKGPSALGSNPRRMWHITWTLARTEFKLAFFGSVLGYLWQLMRPLLLFGVIYLVLSHSSSLSKNGEGLQYYAVSLLLGIVLFGFFSESTGGCVLSIVSRENLVRKIEFPRLAVPLSVVLTGLFNVSLNLIPVLIFLLAAGGLPMWSWLELPFLMAALALFATGLGMLLSVSYVRYRDVKPIWDVIVQTTFYASGIFIAIVGPDRLHPLKLFGTKQHPKIVIDINHVLLSNPFAAILEQIKHAFISSSYPTASQAIGGGAMILIPIGIAVGILVLGYINFNRQAPYVAEQL
jgi:ABC-2 type transport system permease protein